jgi:KDO2-lipid IV(A) lauroyltransferase
MFILRLLSYLPFSVLYLISDFLFVISYHLVGYRKKLVIKNLTNAFPEKTLTEIKRIEKEFYKNLCDYGVETLKLLTMSREETMKRMKFLNPEFVKPFADKNQSLIILASHQFNWEWLLAAGCLYYPFQIDFVYQKQSSALFNKFSLEGRMRFGAFPIERSQVGREAIKRKNILRGISIVADQFPGHAHDKKYWSEFMNQRTAFFLGVSQLAYITQYPAIYLGVRKVKRGYYEAEGFLVSNPPYNKDDNKIVEDYKVVTEKVIRENPSGWLWSHNRWKNRE